MVDGFTRADGVVVVTVLRRVIMRLTRGVVRFFLSFRTIQIIYYLNWSCYTVELYLFSEKYKNKTGQMLLRIAWCILHYILHYIKFIYFWKICTMSCTVQFSDKYKMKVHTMLVVNPTNSTIPFPFLWSTDSTHLYIPIHFFWATVKKDSLNFLLLQVVQYIILG